jgi:hypothetical protein
LPVYGRKRWAALLPCVCPRAVLKAPWLCEIEIPRNSPRQEEFNARTGVWRSNYASRRASLDFPAIQCQKVVLQQKILDSFEVLRFKEIRAPIFTKIVFFKYFSFVMRLRVAVHDAELVRESEPPANRVSVADRKRVFIVESVQQSPPSNRDRLNDFLLKKQNHKIYDISQAILLSHPLQVAYAAQPSSDLHS